MKNPVSVREKEAKAKKSRHPLRYHGEHSTLRRFLWFFLLVCIVSISAYYSGAFTVWAESAQKPLFSQGAITRHTLDNGMVVLIKENHTVALSSLFLCVNSGSAKEGELSGSGISHFIEHMLFKGTKKRAKGDIFREIESCGGTINAFTSYDYTGYKATVPSEFNDLALDEAFKLGKGVLLVSAHLGNWEFGGTIVAMLGYKVSVVALMHKNKKVNDFFISRRRSKGIGIIPLSAAKKGTLAVLKKNEAVGFIGDINFTHPNRGLKVKLFNQETIMPKGPAAFSLKTGAPIITMFAIRQKDNTFRVIFEKPIINTSGLRNSSEMLALTKEITKRIENRVAQYPEQWFMLTPRWGPASNKKGDGS